MGIRPAGAQANCTEALLLDALAHELRSPLSVISGAAETLTSSLADGIAEDDRASLLHRMSASAARMQWLLANLVDMRREGSGALVVRRLPTEMEPLVHRVLDGVDKADRRVEVTVDQPVALIDPFLAERILENLIANAVRHTTPDTSIHVAIEPAPVGVRLAVSDDGPGIPTAHQAAIFERFRRGAGATAGGLGLGLFLVKRFAELHGGQAWLDADEGHTSFNVLLSESDLPANPRSPRRLYAVDALDDSGAGDLLPIGLLVADERGHVVTTNNAWERLSGRSRADSMGEGWLDSLDPGDQPRITAMLARVVESGAELDGPASIDCRLRAAERRPWTRWWVRPQGLDDSGVVMVVADVDADHAREAALRHAASHDPLTGLYNRTQFFEFAEQALRRLERETIEVSVAFVDIDHFKDVNDSGGHRVGDRVLAAVAHKLRGAARPADVIARVGGDEFAVLFEKLEGGTSAEVVAARIRQRLADGVEVDGQVWPVSATVGVATTPLADDSPEALLDRADQAMYEAKRSAH